MKKQLHRSSRNRIIGGVAGGIAEYFDIDPTIVRIIFVITALGWGLSILLYIVLWIILPDEFSIKFREDNQFSENIDNLTANSDSSSVISSNVSRTKVVLGFLLIIIGIILLINNFLSFSIIKYFWPLILVVIGIYIILKSNEHKMGESK